MQRRGFQAPKRLRRPSQQPRLRYAADVSQPLSRGGSIHRCPLWVKSRHLVLR
jgi:hypothetical protein